MRLDRAATLALLVIAGCEGRAWIGPATGAAPAVAESTAEDPIAEALAVWEHGADAIAEPTSGPWAAWPNADGPSTVRWINGDRMPSDDAALAAPFAGFDARVRCFLDSPNVADAVQFGCAVMNGEHESWVEAGLDHDDPLVRLRALVVLMRVRAPRSVGRQWSTLCRLGLGPRAAEFAPVVSRLREAFAPDTLDPILGRPPPNVPFLCPRTPQWAIRAAGVTGHHRALDRLAELACATNLHASLAAVRSLVDFRGPDADAALARCVAAWHYDGAIRAAHALLERDPERLRKTLLAMAPTDFAYWQGLLLARLDDRRAVPILCREIEGVAIVDGEMFDAIARLAGPEHLEDVLALPGRVRPEQVDRAHEVAAVVRWRVGAGARTDR